jgi:arsenate reductase-like glutaredoxin family protein
MVPLVQSCKKMDGKKSITYVEQDLEKPSVQKKLKNFADSIGYAERLNSVPIFAINKKIYIGYNPEQILNAIGRKKSSVKLYTTWETPLKQ